MMLFWIENWYCYGLKILSFWPNMKRVEKIPVFFPLYLRALKRKICNIFFCCGGGQFEEVNFFTTYYTNHWKNAFNPRNNIKIKTELPCMLVGLFFFTLEEVGGSFFKFVMCFWGGLCMHICVCVCGLVLWHINHCRLFNAKSIFKHINNSV